MYVCVYMYIYIFFFKEKDGCRASLIFVIYDSYLLLFLSISLLFVL